MNYIFDNFVIEKSVTLSDLKIVSSRYNIGAVTASLSDEKEVIQRPFIEFNILVKRFITSYV